MNIADYIHEGKENAVSRAELVRLTGIPDRDIRAAVKAANKVLMAEGKTILSTSGKSGYWISEDLAEMEAYDAESRRRAKTQRLNDAPITELINRMKGIKTVHVTGYYRRVRKTDPELDGQISLEG